ncbi:cell division protein FtsQ [Arthrobacter sp. yr096]|uniref:FtsQ-type POTRA domain-containing protein n=1 Tax=Arthrobacter sp. yr096 TaxID=1761750 RepID=UPI0008ADE452|nr:FtsQ-type POTRA domain-containing protein [Arthrobacter sp. yr096]SEJ75628.1 cell division protein FtsQ [Arthrobacter sp. yr096]
MASTRKPTYKAGTDARPVDAGRAGGTKATPGLSKGGDADAVISAQRSVEPDVKGASASKASPASKSRKAAPSDNIIVFPEPKRRRQRRLVAWTLSIVAVVVAVLIGGAVFSPVLAVRTVTVDGTTLLTPEAVQKALSGLEGKPLPQVSEQEINELLKPLVQVRSATMEARPPSELLVHVNERVPVALLKQGETYVMVDVDGVQLGATKDQSAVALPLIDAGAGATNTELFKSIAAVLDTLPADVRARMSTASAASPDAVELKLVDGKTVVWGNAEDRELKAKALEALLKMPADPKVPVSVYDVSVPRHPFTK